MSVQRNNSKRKVIARREATKQSPLEAMTYKSMCVAAVERVIVSVPNGVEE